MPDDITRRGFLGFVAASSLSGCAGILGGGGEKGDISTSSDGSQRTGTNRAESTEEKSQRVTKTSDPTEISTEATDTYGTPQDAANTATPVESPTDQVDTKLEDDLEQLEKDLNRAGYMSSDGGDVFDYSEYLNEVFGYLDIQSFTGEAPIRTRYLSEADSVNQFLTDIAGEFGEVFETTMQRLEDNDLSAISLTSIDPWGFGYGVQFSKNRADEIYNEIRDSDDSRVEGRMRDILLNPDESQKRVSFKGYEADPGIYLEERNRDTIEVNNGTEFTVEFVNRMNESYALEINGELMEIDGSGPIKGTALELIEDPLGEYGSGIAVEHMQG